MTENYSFCAIFFGKSFSKKMSFGILYFSCGRKIMGDMLRKLILFSTLVLIASYSFEEDAGDYVTEKEALYQSSYECCFFNE